MKKNNKHKKIAFFKICIFMAFLTLPMFTWGILKGVNLIFPTIMEKLDYDLGENRTKSKFPTSFNPKTITAELEAYYNDRVPFRSSIITTNRMIYSELEKPYTNTVGPFLVKLIHKNNNSQITDNTTDKDLNDLFGNQSELPSKDDMVNNDSNNTSTECTHNYVTIETKEPNYEWYGYSLCRCSLCGNEIQTDFKDKLIDTSYLPPKIHNTASIEGRMNWLFYNAENNMDYYLGINILNDNQMALWLEKMEMLQAICDEKEIQLVYMIMPTKEQVYSEYLPTYTIENTYKRVPRFIDYVKSNSDINIIYPLEELLISKKYWQVYYKHDTHWNDAGAFIGSQLILKALDKPTTILTDLSITKIQRPVGDLISLGNLDPNLYSDDTDYIIEYKPEINTIFSEGSENEIYKIKTDSQNTEKVVVVGDSFRIHLSHFLYKDFAESTFLHRGYLPEESIKEDIKNSDILVVTANERYDTDMIDSIDSIIEILSE